MKFVAKFLPPDAGTPFTSSSGISCLHHEVLDIAMNEVVIVVAAGTQCQEVLRHTGDRRPSRREESYNSLGLSLFPRPNLRKRELGKKLQRLCLAVSPISLCPAEKHIYYLLDNSHASTCTMARSTRLMAANHGCHGS